jgi:hypothetical protein
VVSTGRGAAAACGSIAAGTLCIGDVGAVMGCGAGANAAGNLTGGGTSLDATSIGREFHMPVS